MSTQDNHNVDPDSLLANIGKSILGPAIVIAVVAHVAVLLLTSFGLYRDWATYGLSSQDYGFHTPTKIKQIKKDRAQAEAEQKRKEELDRKIKEEAKAEEAAATGGAATNQAASASAPAKAASAAPAAGKPAGDKKVTPPEIEPLAPATEASIDDIGL